MIATTAAPAEIQLPYRSRWLTVRRFFRDPKATIAIAILSVYIIVAIFAPLIAPYGENDQRLEATLQGPSRDYPLGTDRLGRDILSRLIYGARVSTSVGLIAVGIAAAVGLPIGLLAGYAGRWVDNVLMRIVDAWIAFPNLLLIMGIVAVLGTGVINVMIAIGLNSFPVYARLIRAQTLSLKERDFVLAARALGSNPLRIALRHVLPNSIQPVIVQASLLVGSAVLAEAGLSFLGIGSKPPSATWGLIISEGFPVIRLSIWPVAAPGVLIFLFVLATSFLGDRLRDVLDPRLSGSR